VWVAEVVHPRLEAAEVVVRSRPQEREVEVHQRAEGAVVPPDRVWRAPVEVRPDVAEVAARLHRRPADRAHPLLWRSKFVHSP